MARNPNRRKQRHNDEWPDDEDLIKSLEHNDWEYTDELIYVFRDCQMEVNLDENEFSDKEAKKIKTAVFQASKEMTLDKSYVKYDGTKYDKVFITQEGWDKLCHLVFDTHNGSKCTKKQQQELLEIYKMMIQSYLYCFVDDLGYDISFIDIDMKDDSHFMAQVLPDKAKAWKHYPGKWQRW